MTVRSPERSRSLVTAALVAGVFAVALLLRFLGLRLGLPYFHHWDEGYIAESAAKMMSAGDDRPNNYYYGAPLMRSTVFAYRVAYHLGLTGFDGAAKADGVSLRLAGRTVTAALSASGAIAVYLVGVFTHRRRGAALFGALAYACAAELVWHGRYLAADASVTSLSVWALASAAAYLREPRFGRALGAVVLAGLAFSLKLPGGLAILVPAAALLWRRGTIAAAARPRPAVVRWLRGARDRALLLGAIPLAGCIFLGLNPHVVDEWRVAGENWAWISSAYRAGWTPPYCSREPGLEHVASAIGYITLQGFDTNPVVSALFSAAALAGLIVLLVRGRPAIAIGVLHAAAVLLAFALPNRAYFPRAYLPCLPILCVGFGAAAERAWLAVSRCSGGGKRARAAVAAALVAAIAGRAIHQSIQCQMRSSDARVRALDFVERQASERGAAITVARSPAVAGASLALGSHPGLEQRLSRPHVRYLPEVSSAAEAAASGADYVLSASYREAQKLRPYMFPYVDDWSFTEADGYRVVARFEANPYEFRFEIVPDWWGRSDVIVLERRERALPGSGGSSPSSARSP